MLSGEVGAGAILDDDSCEQHAINGQAPGVVIRPESIEDVAATMRWAHGNGLSAVPWGNGTLMHLGYPPDRYDVAVKLDLLNKVIDYPSEDMTITVNAGLCLGCLQNILEKKGQYLPIDPPDAKDATLGGLIATNAGGLRRLVEGTLRDLVIGIRVVQADGKVVRGGSRVVKNVAGYDLCKLYTGSLGTLGIIVETTLKLRPLPEKQASVWCEFESPEEAEAGIAAVLESELSPIFIEYLNGNGAKAVGPSELDGWAQGRAALYLGFDGPEEAAQWQMEQLQAVLGTQQSGRCTEIYGHLQEIVRSRLIEFRGRSEAALVCKANILSSEITRFVTSAEKVADENGFAIETTAHAGNGIVYLRSSGDINETGMIAAVLSWTELAVGASGSLVVERAPYAVKEQVDVWGPQRSDFRLMKSIKETLDAERVLNPGRFVGRL